MIRSKVTRRKFLDYAKLSVLFFLSSCQNLTKKISIGFYNNFLPNSLIDSIPKTWIKKNINFQNENLFNQDLMIINDGWIKNLNTNYFEDIETILLDQLNMMSNNYISTWDKLERKKLFPIGVVPYGIVIKNNYLFKITNADNWELLLSEEFTGKMILPNSPRILLSLANKINKKDSLKALINQNNIYDDKNAIDWLINKNANLAILPLTHCQKYLKFDSRLSLIFPNDGVPLMWNFLLVKNDLDQKLVLDWLNKLKNQTIVNRLIRDGWYLPFKNKNIEDSYRYSFKGKKFLIRPSEECWNNSWSFSSLKESEKITLEKFWENL